MSRKIVIQKNVLSIQLGLIKEDEFINFMLCSSLEEDLQNKIVIGQVMQVVKNLKAVFVDYGGDKNGMLHFKQIPECLQDKVQIGSRLPVQITKQNIGDKGHKLTAKLNISGKYLVCLPYEPGINISRKITDASYRAQIKSALMHLGGAKDFGFIVRTHAQNVSMEEVLADAKELIERAHKLTETSAYLAKGSVLYEEPSLVMQLVFEQVMLEDDITIICDDAAYLNTIKNQIKGYTTRATVDYMYYDGEIALWSAYNLQKKLDQLLKRKIWLKNGGNLVIDYTEAMTIVDVNSAKAVLTKSHDKAMLELNLQAVHEVILQILRRNLSGIILVDLVEMKQEAHKLAVYEYAKRCLESYEDYRTKVYPLTELGLLQFSRTKKYQCLPHQLLEACEGCEMPYKQTSFLYALIELEQKIKQVKDVTHTQMVYVEAAPEDIIKMQENHVVALLEAQYPITMQLVKKAPDKNKRILCQFYAK